MKNQNIVVLAIAFAFALAPGGPVPASAANPANAPEATASSTSPEAMDVPVITIHSTGNVLRGKTGSFVLAKLATTSAITASGASGPYVNFKVSGTAIPGVDYVALVSPAYIGSSGYGVISVATLPDPRGPFDRQAYSVVLTLESGAGYALGQPSSAQMWIK
jgi:hypothetical protein